MGTKNLISESELILNEDGSVYHLGLHPKHVAPLIITVGDPDRVGEVSKHFDSIMFRQHVREFCTHVGSFAGRRIMCISTGIGTDNVDIVFNELDALVNVDLETKRPKDEHQQLTFIRLGTSGTFQADIKVDSILASDGAIGLDGLGPFYDFGESKVLDAFRDSYPAFAKTAYAALGSRDLVDIWEEETGCLRGTTLTCAGFYGPQRRSIRLPFLGPSLAELSTFTSQGQRLTNFEMETAGIYGLAHLLGHKAISISAILANRITGEFSEKAGDTVAAMIEAAFGVIERRF